MSKLFISAIIFLLSTTSVFASDIEPASLSKKKISSAGLYVDATGAHLMKQQMGDKALFVDLRTHGEIYALGTAEGIDATVEYEKLSDTFDSKKHNFKRQSNPDFLASMDKLVSAKGLDKNSTIILMCRSGKRSAKAASLMYKAGYTKVYTVVDGFEGDKSHDVATKGQRVVNGWKNAGLPWSYKLSEKASIN